MNWIKNIVRWCLYFSYLFTIVFVLLEIFFRILPTSSPVDLSPVTTKNDVLRFLPNQSTTFSLGSNFYKVVKKSTNNYGFYSTKDYFPNSKPDLMVIGDSYVEATQVRNQDSLGEVIESQATNLNVYQLGVSGVPLSQYIQMIRYAKKEFSPKHYVIVIVGNDFDESLCNYRRKLGTWCFDENFNLNFIPFEGYSLKRGLARNSAFIRYLVFHLGLDWRKIITTFGLHDAGLSARAQYAGNTKRLKPNYIAQASRSAINHFFDEISKMGLSNKITLIVDADRADIYNNLITDSYFRDMRNHLINLAKIKGVSHVDMEKVFKSDFSTFGQRFEFPTDGHWNERTHRLAAMEFLKSYNLR